MKQMLKTKETCRKKVTYITMTILALMLIFSIMLIIIAFKKNEKLFIQYSDTKSLEYNVILKENEYYSEPSIGKGNQYITNLIKSINTTFKYNFNLPIQYNYNYKIEGTASVIDEKTNKTIYTFSDDLLPEQKGQSNGKLDIKKTINVDFNKYNKIIKQFVTTYDLKNVTCNLHLNLVVGIDSSNEEFASQTINAMSLDIPLAKNTISIDTSYNSLNSTHLIEVKQDLVNTTPFIISSIILFSIDILTLIILIIYLKSTQTEEEKYNHQLKKIINNYDSYISRVEDNFDMQQYQILKVQRFSDLLEIRDTMQLPIIMIEPKGQSMTCFVIPTPGNILYFYSIGATQYALPSSKSTIEMR